MNSEEKKMFRNSEMVLIFWNPGQSIRSVSEAIDYERKQSSPKEIIVVVAEGQRQDFIEMWNYERSKRRELVQLQRVEDIERVAINDAPVCYCKGGTWIQAASLIGVKGWLNCLVERRNTHEV